MAQQNGFITLADLLDEQGDSEQDDEVLGRLKLLAQESLPDGWTRWEVCQLTKEEVFGDEIEPNTLNKLTFALPTVGIVRAFDPEANHLSEKGYRELRRKLTDWAFTRALIMGPPAIANKIRGSAARTELFKEAVETVRSAIHTRKETDRILSGEADPAENTTRKRRGTSISAESEGSGSVKKKARSSSNERLEKLEERMGNMFSCVFARLDAIQQPAATSPQDFSDSEYEEEGSLAGSDWEAPSLRMENEEFELSFRPETKEAEPLVPAPSSPIRTEGIECQRFGSVKWNRIRYKEAEQRLHAAPVFSALQINPELGVLGVQSSTLIEKQDKMLGAITHGLLLQGKALVESLQGICKNHPGAAEDVKKILSKGSQFKNITDDILQFVCGHRAEAIEMRRNAFKARNEALATALKQIPPSETHLFEEKAFSSLLKDNGGASQVFQNFQTRPRVALARGKFRKPKEVAHQQIPKPAYYHSRTGTSRAANSAATTSQYRRAAPPTTRPNGPRRTHHKKKVESHVQRPRKY
ncbi:hypothetical protein NE865_14495 [Phthorimaea operculella]|nr:hypothetical protein NE865_14495 [Phthorimaea operculella]